jgi:hypothetical protein
MMKTVSSLCSLPSLSLFSALCSLLLALFSLLFSVLCLLSTIALRFLQGKFAFQRALQCKEDGKEGKEEDSEHTQGILDPSPGKAVLQRSASTPIIPTPICVDIDGEKHDNPTTTTNTTMLTMHDTNYPPQPSLQHTQHPQLIRQSSYETIESILSLSNTKIAGIKSPKHARAEQRHVSFSRSTTEHNVTPQSTTQCRKHVSHHVRLIST